MAWFSPKHASPSMPLEGALGPNDRLEEASAMAIVAPDALCVGGDGALLASSGASVLRFAHWGDDPKVWARFDAPVTALCASPGGRVAVGMRGGDLVVCAASGEPLSGWAPPSRPRAVVDALFLSEDELAVVDHGYGPDEPILSLAPWDATPRGQVVALSRSGATRVLAASLHCPMGAVVAPNGALVVSEFERSRLIEISGRVAQAGFPAYLGRPRRIANGYALACPSRRDPLIDFLKTEREFVARMKATIDPRHWIAPRMTPEFSHDFPIELGATRLFGDVKPWAPSFSYGLVIETDVDMAPVGSAHSRANGFRHAISDVAQWGADLIAVSRASGEILRLGPAVSIDER